MDCSDWDSVIDKSGQSDRQYSILFSCCSSTAVYLQIKTRLKHLSRGPFKTQISRSGRGHESLFRSQCLRTRDLVNYKNCELIVLKCPLHSSAMAPHDVRAVANTTISVHAVAVLDFTRATSAIIPGPNATNTP